MTITPDGTVFVMSSVVNEGEEFPKIYKMSVVKNDITRENVDAITNAANKQLVLGAGVAGAIRNAGGSKIQNECNQFR